MTMPRRAHVYPQVEPGAGALVNAAVATGRGDAPVAEALAVARRRDAAALQLGGEAWVLREDLVRAVALGLADIPASALARPVPVVERWTSEIAVRRRLLVGVPLVVVTDRGAPIGAVTPAAAAGDEAGPSMAGRFAARLGPNTREALTAVAAVATARGARAYAVGGLVRDVLREGANGGEGEERDLDVAIEGDALAVAEELAAETGGAMTVHERFLTASVMAGTWGRIDLATSRAERYDRPGALPRVIPAPIGQDLGRRDFTINAMAVELTHPTLRLLDPHGGRADLAAGRLRVLHPLSFVEDPTRMFRAARYAARLGLREDRPTAAARALALRLAPYPALSGARLAAEITLLVEERRPEVALSRAGVSGALRVLDPRYRFTRRTGTRVAAFPATRAWARAIGLDPDPTELALLALVADQPSDVAQRALRRLAIVGEPLVRLQRALADGDALVRRVAGATRPSERARALRDRSDVELGWLGLVGGDRVREVVAWYVAEGRGRGPVLRGDEVIALGVPRGPAVAQALDDLRDAWLDGRLGGRDAEIAYVGRWLSTRKEG